MAYAIQLSYNNEQESFQIPVNPGSIEIGDGGKGKTYDVIGLGEINVIKNTKLTDYSFSSFFPARIYPFVVTNMLLSPKQYVDYILKWMASRQPIHFIFTGDSFDINIMASIESFDWKESEGSFGDIDYTIKLKKYVYYGPQKAVAVTDDTVIKEEPPRPDDRQPPKTYTLVAGDTLWGVAKKFLGNGARWGEIQKLNNITDAQIKRLQIGMVLKLPEVS
ncbi:LysM domain protein [Oxobacter pfennigii]|uniref:LysM domain protein n=1 Tax=Oxobacter pfennigii TaxID=36849 RepID=A0A0P8WB02_9CLOT|nr:LysM peptidoglycan-binding domain-containing protein [Oxobacter pfennigii]KPU45817.1 LysM domain protein [Oxobacter pfennigii]